MSDKNQNNQIKEELLDEVNGGTSAADRKFGSKVGSKIPGNYEEAGNTVQNPTVNSRAPRTSKDVVRKGVALR